MAPVKLLGVFAVAGIQKDGGVKRLSLARGEAAAGEPPRARGRYRYPGL